MAYSVLTVGLSDKLVAALQDLIIQYDLEFTASSTVREAKRLLEQQVFHLLIIGLDHLKNIHQADWLTDIRRVSFVPLIILSSTPDQDINNMVRLGADMCISGKPPSLRLPVMPMLNSGDTPNTIITTIPPARKQPPSR